MGGLYAAGYSTTQLESIAVHTNWSELLSFSEETKRTDLFVEQKQSEREGYLLIRFDGLQPIIPSSISGGQRLSNYFSYLTLQALYQPNPTFDDLKIPFRATATDLISGQRVILDRGSLAEAMRASITVPLLYSPLVKDSMAMVDGGLTSNIPADAARLSGCDVVIVVNSTSSMRKADQMNAPWEIADQIMTIMMQESNRRQLKLADVVITPVDTSRIVSDFSGVDSLIASGERAGEENIPRILSAIHAHTYASSNLSPDWLRNIVISSEGDPFPFEIQNQFSLVANRDSVSLDEIRQSLNAVVRTGHYSEVFAKVTETDSSTKVVFHAKRNLPITKIDFVGNKLVRTKSIENIVELLKGKDIDPNDLQSTMENILKIYREKGYSLARIDSLKVDYNSGAINFRINEGQIGQIRYEGNEKTKDYIIRREFPLDEGDVFSVDQASQGIVNIKSTGLFDYVLLDVRYEKEKPILILKVKEKSSELLRLGLHADDEHGVVSTVDIRDANFRGAWKTLVLFSDMDTVIVVLKPNIPLIEFLIPI